MRPAIVLMFVCVITAAVTGCGGEPVSADRYAGPDRLFAAVAANVAGAPALTTDLEIDHARLGAAEGSHMPPSRVLLFSAADLDRALLTENRLAALDLPLRVLAFEDDGGQARLITNGFAYLAARYGLDPAGAAADAYDKALATALAGVDGRDLAAFATDAMPSDAVITLDSPFGFAATRDRVMAAIDSQDDTVEFGVIDYQARLRGAGVDVPPTALVLFGGPAPGAKAMRRAPTLGLDAFCQKLLVWQGDDGAVHVSFNDLLMLAERQDAPRSPALRVIARRMRQTFEQALQP
jgi:uncharacterized protein (DUF302 family)